MRMLRFLLICIPTSFLLLLSGCWDRRENNELAFVSCIAMDEDGDKRVVTAEVIRPAAVAGGGEGGGGGTTTAAVPQRAAVIVSDEATTLYAAERKLALRLPRRTYVAHTTAILVGENLARRGLKEVLDFLDRQHEHRRSTFILLTRGPARQVLVSAQAGLETTLGREIVGLSKWVKVSGYGFIPTVHDVLLDLSQGSASTVIPVLELSPQPLPPVTGSQASRETSSTGTERQTPRLPEPQMMQTVRFQGAGLLKHDKLVAFLDEVQVRGLAWARKWVRRAVLELKCPLDHKGISVEITEAQGKTSVKTSSGQLQGIIEIKVEGNLLEQQCSHDLTSEEVTKLLEGQVEEIVAKEINGALSRSKEVGTDVFDFGSALYRHQPKLWKEIQPQWEDVFKKLPITIQVEAKLRRTGLTGRPWSLEAN